MSTLLDLYKIASDDNRNNGTEAAAGAAAIGAGGYGAVSGYKDNKKHSKIREANLDRGFPYAKNKRRAAQEELEHLQKAKWYDDPGAALYKLFGRDKELKDVLEKDKTNLKNVAKSRLKGALGAATALAGGGLLYDASKNKKRN